MFFSCYQTRYQSDAHSYDGAGGSFFVDAVGSTSLSYPIFPNISKYGTATNPKYDLPAQIAEAPSSRSSKRGLSGSYSVIWLWAAEECGYRLQFEQKARSSWEFGKARVNVFQVGKLKEEGRETECAWLEAIPSSQRGNWCHGGDQAYLHGESHARARQTELIQSLAFLLSMFFFCSFSTFLFSLVNLAHCSIIHVYFEGLVLALSAGGLIRWAGGEGTAYKLSTTS